MICCSLRRRPSSGVFRLLFPHVTGRTLPRRFVATDSLTDTRRNATRFAGVEQFFNRSVPTTSSSEPSPSVPYVDERLQEHWGSGRKVYYETYGCQMNVNDVEIVRSLLTSAGYTEAPTVENADVVLIMTCAIREGAENKIWRRLGALKLLKTARLRQGKELLIGILGCMAERLKERVVEREKSVDVVAGPDAYRDLPRLLASTGSGQAAVNVLLSLDETYADVTPLRVNVKNSNAFVLVYCSTMRGCDNMCTYCIVPFTRGRERSRSIDSILEEVRMLSDQGFRQVTLLGQNVNSYRDTSESSVAVEAAASSLSAGFRTVYRPKLGGRRFADLLYHVSLIDPEMRVRFIAAHPKDFPDEVLSVISERPNVCHQVHLPAQHGNNDVLERMGRGYTVEAYMALVENVRAVIPGVAITSDFIAGFCGETEEEHRASLDLINWVEYEMAFCYPYSMREVYRKSENYRVGRLDGGSKLLFKDGVLMDYRNPTSVTKIDAGDYLVTKVTDITNCMLFGEPKCKISLSDYYRDYAKISSDASSNDVASINA